MISYFISFALENESSELVKVLKDHFKKEEGQFDITMPAPPSMKRIVWNNWCYSHSIEKMQAFCQGYLARKEIKSSDIQVINKGFPQNTLLTSPDNSTHCLKCGNQK